MNIALDEIRSRGWDWGIGVGGSGQNFGGAAGRVPGDARPGVATREGTTLVPITTSRLPTQRLVEPRARGAGAQQARRCVGIACFSNFQHSTAPHQASPLLPFAHFLTNPSDRRPPSKLHHDVAFSFFPPSARSRVRFLSSSLLELCKFPKRRTSSPPPSLVTWSNCDHARAAASTSLHARQTRPRRYKHVRAFHTDGARTSQEQHALALTRDERDHGHLDFFPSSLALRCTRPHGRRFTPPHLTCTSFSLGIPTKRVKPL